MSRSDISEEARTESELGLNRAHSARMYNYYLGGKNNYIVDREAAAAVLGEWPAMPLAARANRAYMERAGRYLARQGVRQYVDVGTGMPFAPNLHDVVQAVTPWSTIVYADNDPIVRVYGDELEDGTAEGDTRFIQADMTHPEAFLAALEQEGCIDFAQPVALTMHAVLDFIPDGTDPHRIVDRLLARLAPGSYLSLTHCTGDFAPEAWEAVADVYQQHGVPATARTRAAVLRFFEELELVEPGLVVAHRWRPEPASGPSLVTDTRISVYVGMARKGASN